MPRASSIGQSADGSHRTARLKVYPPQFCRAIALTWWNHVILRPVGYEINHDAAEQRLFDVFNCAVQKMHSALPTVDAEQTYGPDYHPAELDKKF